MIFEENELSNFGLWNGMRIDVLQPALNVVKSAINATNFALSGSAEFFHESCEFNEDRAIITRYTGIYCLKYSSDFDRYLILNRGYKPFGIVGEVDTWVDYAPYMDQSIDGKVVRMFEDRLITYDLTDSFWLYDELHAPWESKSKFLSYRDLLLDLKDEMLGSTGEKNNRVELKCL
jgi:hypothetical protein